MRTKIFSMKIQYKATSTINKDVTMIHGYRGVDTKDLCLYLPEYKGAVMHCDLGFDTRDLCLYFHLYKSATLGDQGVDTKDLYLCLHVFKTLRDRGVDTKDPPSLPLGPPNDKQEMAQMLKDE